MIRSSSIFDNRIRKEADSLSKNNNKVVVFEWDRDNSLPKVQNINNYLIYRFKFKATYGIKVVIFLPIFWSYLFFWLLKENFDVLHASDFDTYIIALIVSKLKRKPIVYDIFDFYADLMQPGLLSNIISKIDKYLMRYANYIIIADKSRIEQIGIASNNIIEITNSPNDVTNLSKSEVEFANNDKKTTIFFASTLQKERFLNIDNVIQAINGLDDIKLIIAGNGNEKDELIKMSEGNKNIEFIGYVPYERVIELTLKSDILFCLYDPCLRNNRYASPNKLFEAMMCSKPILVSNGTIMINIVRAHNCGIIVNCRDIEEIRKKIIYLKDNPDIAKSLGSNGRIAYDTYYSWSIMENRLLSLYNKLV